MVRQHSYFTCPKFRQVCVIIIRQYGYCLQLCIFHSCWRWNTIINIPISSLFNGGVMGMGDFPWRLLLDNVGSSSKESCSDRLGRHLQGVVPDLNQFGFRQRRSMLDAIIQRESPSLRWRGVHYPQVTKENCAVPQGSVLVLLQWDIDYDWVLQASP